MNNGALALMIVSIKEIGGHDDRAEIGIAAAA